MLKWVLERCEGGGKAVETIIGSVPTADAIDVEGKVSPENMAALLKVDPPEWVEAVAGQDEFFAQFGTRLPREIDEEHQKLARAIANAITPPDARTPHH